MSLFAIARSCPHMNRLCGFVAGLLLVFSGKVWLASGTPLMAGSWTPPWAIALADAPRSDVDSDAGAPTWEQVQVRLGLTDAQMQSILKLLASNDAFPSNHWLHDLRSYPREFMRVLHICALGKIHSADDLTRVAGDLQARFASYRGFLDEGSEDKHLWMQDQITDGIVLAVFNRMKQTYRTSSVVAVLLGLREINDHVSATPPKQ